MGGAPPIGNSAVRRRTATPAARSCTVRLSGETGSSRVRGRERPLRIALAAALALAAAGACREAGPPPEPAPTLRVAVQADVTGFFPNPPIEDEGFTFEINWLIYEGLVGFDRRMRPRPALASRWTNPHELAYLFELRRDARFSDGRPVTAADVAASLRAVRVQRWVTLDYLQAVESVRATDDGTVEIRTRYPYSILMTKLPWGLVLPEEHLGEVPTPVLGSGPYRLESWDPGHGFVLARNPHYAPEPAFERAEFSVVSDDDARVARLVRGEADVIDQVPLERLEGLQSGGLHVARETTMRVVSLGMRLDAPPFSDPRVREAVSLAIDRDELVARAYGGLTEPATQLVPPAVVGYNPDLEPPAPDRQRARALLAEAGFPDGLDVRLDGPHNRYVYDEEMMAEVARQLAQVGIRVSVNALEKAAFFRLAVAGRSPFHLLGWECKSGEAGEALDPMMHSPAPGYGGVNTTGVADPELDRLIEAAAAATDASRRSRLLSEALARIEALRPVVPLLVQAQAVAWSDAVKWEPDGSTALRVTDMRPSPGGRGRPAH